LVLNLSDTQRYRLTIEYDGSPYVGWQRQIDMASVQGAIENALVKIGEVDPVVQGAGRTDAGVHALGQIAHADLQRPWVPFRLMEALNAQMRQAGDTVAITDCEITNEDFHARFSAIQRHYVYRIIARRAPLTVERGRAWNVKQELDVDAMNDAAAALLGEHDFSTFRSTECQAKSPIKTLDTLAASQRNLHGVTVTEISTTARSYLHNQVRSFAGALKLVGEGKWSRQDLEDSLNARDRKACAPVAPAHGLYLVSVGY
jgi:tRNA pseudouridine38-40 synthase